MAANETKTSNADRQRMEDDDEFPSPTREHQNIQEGEEEKEDIQQFVADVDCDENCGPNIYDGDSLASLSSTPTSSFSSSSGSDSQQSPLKASFATPSNVRRNSYRPTPLTQPMTPEDGYVGDVDVNNELSQRELFRSPAQHHRRSSSSRGSILRRSSSSMRSSSRRSKKQKDAAYLSSETSDSSPDRSGSSRDSSSSSLLWEKSHSYRKRAASPILLDEKLRAKTPKGAWYYSRRFLWILWATLCMIVLARTLYRGTGMTATSQHDVEEIVRQYERIHASRRAAIQSPSSGGLRGPLVRTGYRAEGAVLRHYDPPKERSPWNESSSVTTTTTTTTTKSVTYHYPSKPLTRRAPSKLKFTVPSPLRVDTPSFDILDQAMYATSQPARRRIVYLGTPSDKPRRKVEVYPAEFTDNTQYYGQYDSNDERLSRMEVREPLDNGECVAMKDWQRTFHPVCNGMHEISFDHPENGDDYQLFGVKGYWRNAWRMDMLGGATFEKDRETIVLKTLRYQHNFEDAHFEHDRVDAVAMERLTSSPHVINIFGFCGHSVMTEFADGKRLGELADKSKKKPLERLKIARDIAAGLADVHGIDGDGNTTFVHLDINPANVVSIGGTLKLNDFNIGILLRWNTTSNKQCGFPTQYPNPQWRSPEEANGDLFLTEKVDVFSMGHIFFRLICGHEPWNKLEKGGKPSKEVISEKVKQGIMPRIPASIMKSTDPEIVAIRSVMIKCYTVDPKKRPSARHVANILGRAFKKLTAGTTLDSNKI